ncbi:MAG: hypothetical protein QNJ32_22535 [Xenococcaceae cyanobacterium MO_167.B27]|nr:hypothetical protein [Xenococcaceae cyanobacterium MO_167.B27]
MKKIRSQKEIRVFGIRRSGNHAVISWIIDNYPGKVVFINNINFQDTIDFPIQPFNIGWKRPFVDHMVIKGLQYWRCKKNLKPKRKLISLIKYILAIPERFTLYSRDKFIDIEYARLVKKDLLMYSFEDISSNDSRLIEFYKNQPQYIGNSYQKINLLVLRDPWNLFASMLKTNMFERNEQDKIRYINLFKEYAKEFIKSSKNETSEVVCANYNKWVFEPDYKVELGQKLGFSASEEPYEKLSNRGGGSSFDGRNYQSNASSMKVLERWKVFQNDEFYQEIFTDSELVELGIEIFGDITGLYT